MLFGIVDWVDVCNAAYQYDMAYKNGVLLPYEVCFTE